MNEAPTRERIEPGWDLIDGVPVERDMGVESDYYGSRLIHYIQAETDRSGVGLVFGSSAGYRYPELAGNHLRLPDVSFVRRERLIGGIPRGWFAIPADLIIEVASPNDEAGDLQGKVREWIDGGAKRVWVVYPDQREITVHYPDRTARTYGMGESVPGEEIIPGFSLSLDELFRAPFGQPERAAE
jgi:Uma2 family endonuclease